MTRRLLLLCLLSTAALAGETYRGIIISGAGADTTNASTATPFVLPGGSKVTIACTAAAFICVGPTTCTASLTGANPGVPVTANEKFPTSTNSLVSGVTISSAPTAVIRIVSTTAVNCVVWERRGNE